MTLAEFRELLLRVDHPDILLRLADKYLTLMEELGDTFVLPKAHEVVKPALEYYCNDLEGWVKFVASVRDRLPVHGRKLNHEVHQFYRTLLVRLTQQQRRERLGRAVDVAVRKGATKNDTDSTHHYARRCTQVWKLRRETMMKTLRQATAKGRLNTDERELELAEFWKLIDEEISHGEVPKP